MSTVGQTDFPKNSHFLTNCFVLKMLLIFLPKNDLMILDFTVIIIFRRRRIAPILVPKCVLRYLTYLIVETKLFWNQNEKWWDDKVYGVTTELFLGAFFALWKNFFSQKNSPLKLGEARASVLYPVLRSLN